MRVYAAIDLLGGRCVRLLRGDYAKATVYAHDPIATARALVGAGARGLHVIDLDGARSGRPAHQSLIGDLARAVPVELQVGGGVRDLGTIQALLDAGAARVLVGTAALRSLDWTRDCVRQVGSERLAVAVDVRGERVWVSGWQEAVERGLDQVLDDLESAGVTTLLVTDIDRDGTLQGPNLALYRRLSGRRLRIIAAGGISRAGDLDALADARVYGAVVGRAVYEGTVRPEELALFAGREPGLRAGAAPRGTDARPCS